MLFVRIGKYALDIESCVFQQVRKERSDVKGIYVHSVESFTVWSNQQPEVYEDLLSYVMAMPTLAQINAERAYEAEAPEHNFASEAQEATYVSAEPAQRWYQCDDDDDSAFVPDEIDEDDEVTGGAYFSDAGDYGSAVSPLD